jgi:hypothetical protein
MPAREPSKPTYIFILLFIFFLLPSSFFPLPSCHHQDEQCLFPNGCQVRSAPAKRALQRMSSDRKRDTRILGEQNRQVVLDRS